jgi:hypothetical protein
MGYDYNPAVAILDVIKTKELIGNAFRFRKQKIFNLLKEESECACITQEYIQNYLLELDNIYQNFILSFNQPNLAIYRVNDAKDIIQSYVDELKRIKGMLDKIIPLNEDRPNKMTHEIDILIKVIDSTKDRI